MLQSFLILINKFIYFLKLKDVHSENKLASNSRIRILLLKKCLFRRSSPFTIWSSGSVLDVTNFPFRGSSLKSDVKTVRATETFNGVPLMLLDKSQSIILFHCNSATFAHHRGHIKIRLPHVGAMHQQQNCCLSSSHII